MNRSIVFPLVLIILAVFLAPIIIKGLYYLVIEPLSYYWWRLKLVFQMIPQSAYWFFIIITVGLVFLFYYLRDIFLERSSTISKVSEKGKVLILSEQLVKSKKRNYFKWLIANRLSKLTLNVLNEKLRNPDLRIDDLVVFEDLIYPDIKPDIKKYLEAGLRGSFSTNRRKIQWPLLGQREGISFNLDLNDVVTFIESQAE